MDETNTFNMDRRLPFALRPILNYMLKEHNDIQRDVLDHLKDELEIYIDTHFEKDADGGVKGDIDSKVFYRFFESRLAYYVNEYRDNTDNMIKFEEFQNLFDVIYRTTFNIHDSIEEFNNSISVLNVDSELKSKESFSDEKYKSDQLLYHHFKTDIGNKIKSYNSRMLELSDFMNEHGILFDDVKENTESIKWFNESQVNVAGKIDDCNGLFETIKQTDDYDVMIKNSLLLVEPFNELLEFMNLNFYGCTESIDKKSFDDLDRSHNSIFKTFIDLNDLGNDFEDIMGYILNRCDLKAIKKKNIWGKDKLKFVQRDPRGI
ncbi:MAG: hypothetical protein KAI18_02165 [Candidatus Aenigmarchaeota archaeon]|nr:hypothetical protein [Candidatus Aenigmarchaeota archaeon]